VKLSIKTCVKRDKSINGTCIHIWVHCLCPWDILFSLFDWVLMEGVTQDPSDASQVSDRFYGGGLTMMYG
jgi:hypothetical protein